MFGFVKLATVTRCAFLDEPTLVDIIKRILKHFKSVFGSPCAAGDFEYFYLGSGLRCSLEEGKMSVDRLDIDTML